MKQLMTRTLLFSAILSLSTIGVFAQDDAAALYKAKCQACHGADGKATAAGQKMGARDFSSAEVTKMSDQEMVEITKNGKNKMPKYEGKLTDDQIKGLVKYIRTLK